MQNKIYLFFPGERGVKDLNLPLSLLYIAKPLVEQGYQVRLVDCRVEDYRQIDFKDVLYAGISAMSGRQVHCGMEVAHFIKEQDSSIPIVWGGPHPTIIPEQTIASDVVDIVVRGEGEETLLALTRVLQHKGALETVAGLTFKRNGNIVVTADTQPIDLDKIGDLPYHLLRVDAYPLMEKFDYISSKGCPHRCRFCSDSANHKRKWRAKSAEVVVRELENIIQQFGVKRINIQDANFFVNRQRVEEICRRIIAKKWDLELYAFIRCDYLSTYDSAFIALLRKAGFRELAFGAESGSDRVLNFISKDTTTRQIIDATSALKQHDIKPVISLMMGIPTESETELNQTIQLYDQIMDIYPSAMVNGIFIFTPFPGAFLTELITQEYGYRPPKRLADWGKWRWSDAKNITWASKKIRTKYQTIYLIARYFFVMKILRSWSFARKRTRCGSVWLALLVVLFNTCFLIPSKLRWQYRWFKYPLELKVWYYFYDRFKGVD